MPLPLALLAPAAIGLGKTIAGGIQSRKARKEQEALEANRPELERTAASKEVEATARNLAGTSRLPGQSAMEGQLGAATSRGVQAAKSVGGSASDILGATTALAGAEQAGVQNIGIQGAQMQRQAQGNLQSVLGGVSQEQYAMQDYNKLAPWREKLKQSQQRTAEGRKMIGSGLSDIGSAAGQSGLSIGGGGGNAGVGTSASSRRRGGIVGL